MRVAERTGSAMEIAFEHEIYFSNKNHLLLTDVARSLLALDRNAKAVPVVLEKLYDDVRSSGIDLYIEELHAGSLTEKIKFKLRLALQQRIESESGSKLGKLSKEPKERQEQIVAWLVTAVVLIGLKVGAEAIKSGASKPNLDNNIEISLDEGSRIATIDQQVLNIAIVDALHETPGSVTGAVEFARPAKKDPEASININNRPFVSSGALSEVPSATIEADREKTLELADTEILIRATDRDSGKKGWGATIPAFSDSRMRVTVAPGIDLNALAHQDSVVGNVTIFYATDSAGNVVKRHAHIYSVRLERASSDG